LDFFDILPRCHEIVSESFSENFCAINLSRNFLLLRVIWHVIQALWVRMCQQWSICLSMGDHLKASKSLRPLLTSRLHLAGSAYLFFNYLSVCLFYFHSVLWHCWFGGRKGIWPPRNLYHLYPKNSCGTTVYKSAGELDIQGLLGGGQSIYYMLIALCSC